MLWQVEQNRRPCGLKNKNAPAMLQNMAGLRPSWEDFRQLPILPSIEDRTA
jgi:hypothetical protein